MNAIPFSTRVEILALKTFVQKNFSATLLIFCALGLIFPQFGHLPSYVIILCLASGIFIACFSIRAQEFSDISLSRVLLFYLCRFLLLPLLIFAVFSYCVPKYALMLFLFASLPPGVSCPAMNRLFGGNISLSFALTVLGNLLLPLVLPSMLFLVVGEKTNLDISQVFYTLLFSILTPILVFLTLRKKLSVQRLIQRDGSFLTALCIGMTVAIAVAKRRSQILEDPFALIPFFLISAGAFALFYCFGWLFNRKASLPNKIAHSLASGAINISLGVSIALLYFPPEISLFLIVGEIPWILALMPFKTFTLGRHESSQLGGENENARASRLTT